MLNIKNVSALYDHVKVLHDISFHVPQGENMSIIGPNGCGKTTLLRTISNIIPFEGRILIDSQDIKKIKRKNLAKRIALLSQINTVTSCYSVFDTIMMGRYAYQNKRLLSCETKEDVERIEDALKVVHLDHIKNQNINTLSGGQLQRVLFAKILVQNPDIILLDEPTNHLDLFYQIELIQFLKKWSIDNNKTVIGVLHDMNLAYRLSNQILLLKDGRIQKKGSTVDVLNSPELKETFGFDVKQYMNETYQLWNQISKKP